LLRAWTGRRLPFEAARTTWTTRTADISAWAGQTIQWRVEALDANPGSLIEAGVDSVTIIRQ
jgi:hypothetical protein